MDNKKLTALVERMVDYGLTLQAPWGACIAWGGKRIENRSRSVASAIGMYRGTVALTASALYKLPDGRRVSIGTNMDAWTKAANQVADLAFVVRWTRGVTPALLAQMAGRWFATARVADLVAPRKTQDGWHMPGQWGIVLDEVEVLPEPWERCTGGLGFFRFERCVNCGHPGAAGSRHRCPAHGPIRRQQ